MSERLKELELVGRGAMAEVYRGVLSGERGTQRQVAIKRLRAELRDDAAAVELFVSEARLATQLSHPNIVTALELIRDDQGYALVCEWLDSATLAELRDRCGPLPLAAVVHIGRAICAALGHIHAPAGSDAADAAIIHRDVNPANILVTADGHVRLGDFGVASCGQDNPLVEIEAAYTPGFEAPEQAAGGQIDPRTDLCGLGKTLASLVDDAPEELVQVLRRAHDPDPEGRYASAGDLEAALAHVAQSLGTPIGPNGLRDWIASRGGLPRRTLPPPALDGAVRSIMGGALQAAASDAQAVARPARSRRLAWAAAAVVLVAIGVAAFLMQADEPQPEPQAPGSAHSAPAEDSSASVVTREPAQLAPGASPQVPDSTTTRQRDPARMRPAAPTPTLSAAQPRPAEPTRYGEVSINAVPWAKVTIDGRTVGNTPLRALRLKAGKHVLRLENPARSLQRELRFDVTPEKQQTILINLQTGTMKRRVEP